MRVLYQPLADLSIGCFEVGTSSVRASDVVHLMDDQAKEWRPWLDDWDNDSWMMNCRQLLVVHFFCPQNSFVDSHVSMAWWLRFSVFECRLIFSPNCPLELHFAPDGTNLMPIIPTVFFSFKRATKIFYLCFFFFLCLYFCLSHPFRFLT